MLSPSQRVKRWSFETFNFTRNTSSYLQCIYEAMKPTLQMELSCEVKDSSQILRAVAGVSWKSSWLPLSYDDFTSWRTAQSTQVCLKFPPIGIKSITKLLQQKICKQLKKGIYVSADWKMSKLTYSETQLLSLLLHHRIIYLPKGSLRQLVYSKVGIKTAIDSGVGKKIAVNVSNLSIFGLEQCSD